MIFNLYSTNSTEPKKKNKVQSSRGTEQRVGENTTAGFTEVSVSVSAAACGSCLVRTELSTMSIQAQARLTSVPSLTIS